MDVTSLRGSTLREKPRYRPLGAPSESELETAVRRSQDYLLSQQKPEGYWVGELMVDATLVADMIAYHHWNGKVDPQWQRKAVNHIFSMQLPDGGWNIYYGGPAEVNATIKAYLALKLAGVPVTDPRMLRAREVALNLGRRAAHEHLLEALPGAAGPVPVGIRADHSLRGDPDRQMVLRELQRDEFLEPLDARAAGHHQPFQADPRRSRTTINLNELYPEGIHERDLALAPDPERITWRNFFLWLDRVHKFAEWFAENGIHPFRKRALQQGRAMDAGAVRRLGRPGGDLPGDAQFADRPQGAGLSGRSPAGASAPSAS